MPSLSAQAAAAGRTTSASSAVAVRKMSWTTMKSRDSRRCLARCLVGLGLERVLADARRSPGAHPAPSRRTSPTGASRASAGRSRPRPRRTSPAARRSRRAGSPAAGSGRAPMSPPPWTLFWPRSGLRPLPYRPTWPVQQRQVDQREDVVDRVVVLGDAEGPADHRPVGGRERVGQLADRVGGDAGLALGVLERVRLDAWPGRPRSRRSRGR